MKASVKRIALVSCVKTKKQTASPAKDLYTSPLFRGLREYAEAHADEWYILSAKYGVLSPDQITSPYELTLNKMAKAARVGWAVRTQVQLLDVLIPGAEVILLAGMRYREGIESLLKDRGFTVTVPLKGVSFGKQLAWLNQQNAARRAR